MHYHIEDLLVYPYCCCSAENLRKAARPRFEPGTPALHLLAHLLALPMYWYGNG